MNDNSEIKKNLNMLSKSNPKTTTELENKLKNNNYPLEDYLNDDEAIPCFENMDKNTKKYFSPKIVKKLIRYITEAPEKDDYLQGHKYPYISYKLLKTDCPYIQDLFILTQNEYNEKYKIDKINFNDDTDKKDTNNKIIINEKPQNEFIENNGNNNIDIKNNINKHKNLENKQINEIKNIKDISNENNFNDEKNKINIEEKNEIYEKDKNNLIIEDNKEKENKMVKIKELHNNEFLDLLLDFIVKEKKELNNILCGYFSDVLMALIDKYPFYILIYLYTKRKDALEEIVNHSYEKSISIISSKLLKLSTFIEYYSNRKYEDYKDEILYLLKEFNNYRNILIEKIIFSITINGINDEKGIINDNYYTENIFSLLYDLMCDKNILLNIVNNYKIYYYIFELIIKNDFINNEGINENQKKMFILSIELLTEIIWNIYKNRKDFKLIKDLDELKNSISFNTILFIAIKPIINNFVDLSSIDSKYQNSLGIHNIYIIDFIQGLYFYMKEAPLMFYYVLKESNFFVKSFNYFFKYQWNNIFHFKFIRFLKKCLDDDEDKNEYFIYHIFYELKMHEIIAYYINQDNKSESDFQKISDIIKEEYKEFINKIKNYKNKYYFKSGKFILSGAYSHIVHLIYIIQAKCGLKTFDEKDKKELRIKNIGEFEFIKDEKSKKEIKQIKISNFLYSIISKSDNWKYVFDNIIFPLIKKYEERLLYKEFIELINTNNKNNNIIKESLDKYNDINFWEIKLSILNEIKNKIMKYQEKENDLNENENKIENNNIIDEEYELLGIAMKLEEDEQKKNKGKNVYGNNQLNKNKIYNSNNSSSNNVNKKDKKNDIIINNDKGKEDNEYNDINFWKIKTESLLNKSEINNIFDNL